MATNPIGWMRCRYSTKLAAVLGGVIVLTLAVGTLFTAHVLQSGADGQSWETRPPPGWPAC